MYDKADVFNEILRHLGQPATVIDPDVAGARGPHGEAIAAAYKTLLPAVLRKHPWNFATERKTLSVITEAVPFGGGAYFEVPAGVLRVWSIPREGNGRDVVWRRERRFRIWADQTAGPLYAFCIMLVEDTTEFDPEFFKVLTLEGAADCALAITGSSERRKDLLDAAQDALPDAAGTDSQESGADDVESGGWREARDRVT